MPLGSAPFGSEEPNQFGPLGTYWSVTFWEAVRIYLKGDARLAGLSEVYLEEAGSRFRYPLLIFKPTFMASMLDTGASVRTEWDVMFSLLADDDVEANVLGQAAWRVLAPKQPGDDGTEYTRPMIWASDGIEMGSVPGRENLVKQPGRSTGNRNVWAYQFTYRMTVVRSQLG
jgi:hypothetical protein